MKNLMFLISLLFTASAWAQNSYSTTFPATENPISQSGKWLNGATNGVAWTNVQTTPGLAFGTQSGNAAGDARYADSTAVLTGSWGSNQEASGIIYVANAPTSSSVYQEVEIRLRTTITTNSITGYEINCSVSANSNNSYLQIVRWNGPLASWTQLNGSSVHCVNGDTLRATIKGSTINVYLNGTLVESATDSTYTSGSPGIGFFLQGTTGTNATYGFTSFAADDTGSPAPPTNVKGTAIQK